MIAYVLQVFIIFYFHSLAFAALPPAEYEWMKLKPSLEGKVSKSFCDLLFKRLIATYTKSTPEKISILYTKVLDCYVEAYKQSGEKIERYLLKTASSKSAFQSKIASIKKLKSEHRELVEASLTPFLKSILSSEKFKDAIVSGLTKAHQEHLIQILLDTEKMLPWPDQEVLDALVDIIAVGQKITNTASALSGLNEFFSIYSKIHSNPNLKRIITYKILQNFHQMQQSLARSQDLLANFSFLMNVFTNPETDAFLKDIEHFRPFSKENFAFFSQNRHLNSIVANLKEVGVPVSADQVDISMPTTASADSSSSPIPEAIPLPEEEVAIDDEREILLRPGEINSKASLELTKHGIVKRALWSSTLSSLFWFKGAISAIFYKPLSKGSNFTSETNYKYADVLVPKQSYVKEIIRSGATINPQDAQDLKEQFVVKTYDEYQAYLRELESKISKASPYSQDYNTLTRILRLTQDNLRDANFIYKRVNPDAAMLDSKFKVDLYPERVQVEEYLRKVDDSPSSLTVNGNFKFYLDEKLSTDPEPNLPSARFIARGGKYLFNFSQNIKGEGISNQDILERKFEVPNSLLAQIAQNEDTAYKKQMIITSVLKGSQPILDEDGNVSSFFVKAYSRFQLPDGTYFTVFNDTTFAKEPLVLTIHMNNFPLVAGLKGYSYFEIKGGSEDGTYGIMPQDVKASKDAMFISMDKSHAFWTGPNNPDPDFHRLTYDVNLTEEQYRKILKFMHDLNQHPGLFDLQKGNPFYFVQRVWESIGLDGHYTDDMSNLDTVFPLIQPAGFSILNPIRFDLEAHAIEEAIPPLEVAHDALIEFGQNFQEVAHFALTGFSLPEGLVSIISEAASMGYSYVVQPFTGPIKMSNARSNDKAQARLALRDALYILFSLKKEGYSLEQVSDELQAEPFKSALPGLGNLKLPENRNRIIQFALKNKDLAKDKKVVRYLLAIHLFLEAHQRLNGGIRHLPGMGDPFADALAKELKYMSFHLKLNTKEYQELGKYFIETFNHIITQNILMQDGKVFNINLIGTGATYARGALLLAHAAFTGIPTIPLIIHGCRKVKVADDDLSLLKTRYAQAKNLSEKIQISFEYMSIKHPKFYHYLMYHGSLPFGEDFFKSLIDANVASGLSESPLSTLGSVVKKKFNRDEINRLKSQLYFTTQSVVSPRAQLGWHTPRYQSSALKALDQHNFQSHLDGDFLEVPSAQEDMFLSDARKRRLHVSLLGWFKDIFSTDLGEVGTGLHLTQEAKALRKLRRINEENITLLFSLSQLPSDELASQGKFIKDIFNHITESKDPKLVLKLLFTQQIMALPLEREEFNFAAPHLLPMKELFDDQLQLLKNVILPDNLAEDREAQIKTKKLLAKYLVHTNLAKQNYILYPKIGDPKRIETRGALSWIDSLSAKVKGKDSTYQAMLKEAEELLSTAEGGINLNRADQILEIALTQVFKPWLMNLTIE